MEVRAGYKQTEVGVIPEDWQVSPISALLASPIQNGVFNEPSRKGRGCKLINVIDLYGRFPLETEGLERFAANRGELSRFSVRRGDIFFTRSSLTADGIAQCNIYYCDEEEVVFDCHIIRVRPNSIRVEPLFLARICGSNAARRYLVLNAKTTTMTTIDQSVIARLPVAVPPITEQRTIAATLSDVDGLLGGLDRLIAKKRDLKQAAMQQLLTGQTRLSGFHSEWEVKSVSEIALKIIDYRGRTPLKLGMNWGGGDIPVLSARNVKMGYIDFEEESYFASEALYTRWMTNGDAKKGDILMTTEAPLGNVALIPDDRKYILSQRTILLQVNSEIAVSPFLFHAMTGDSFQKLLLDNSSGSTATGIQRKRLEKLEIFLPSLPEQIAIAEALTEMDKELTALEQRRGKTRALKQAMMQELLTGRTRLV